MKKIALILGLSFVGFLSLTLAKSCTSLNYVTVDEFRETDRKLNLRIDTMQRKLDDLRFLVNTIDTTTKSIDKRLVNVESSLDTLKIGQLIIYDEVTKFNSISETKSNFIDNLIKWLE